jgi:beta-N-acetylhexosaminidase
MSAALGVLLPGFNGPELPEWLAARLRDGLAGVCLFATNIESRTQLRTLTASIREANPRAIIAIDEEGGDVTRLYQAVGSPYPGNAILGRIDDVSYTEFIGRSVGWELRLAGCTLDFAPDVDINSNDDNPVIGVRSFGSDPQLVARHSAAWVRGIESTGIAASAKHFPGHGDTAVDSHLALPVVDLPLATLRARELLPFRAAIDAGARTIMTSHILLPQVDARNAATFSRTILSGLLRAELGFTGVIVSDALDMVGASGEHGLAIAAVRAIEAGCDLLCIGTDNSREQVDELEAELQSAVLDGRLDAARLGDAARRVAELAESLAADAARIPIPEYVTSDDEPAFHWDRTSGAFDVSPSVEFGANQRYFQFETPANIAVGAAPWGARAAIRGATVVREGDEIVLTGGVQPVLIGRNNHRHEWVRLAVDDLRARHPSAVIVDMGWPSSDRRYADIATFGASRHTTNALVALISEAAATSDSATAERVVST